MKDKYEISLWDDYLVVASGDIPAHYEEKKLVVIGSDSMTSPCRAEEPKLVQNINGTNTLSFKMRYTYREEGKDYKNPFLKYLVNERKIKCFWKDKWYDFVIKDCNEDSSSKSITYTCKDLFINELSKTGFNLEFDTELENNQGTVQELGARIVDGTDWQIDTTNSDIVFQTIEENVYEAIAQNGFDAVGVNPATGADTTVHVTAGDTLLVFYSSFADQTSFTQFWYASGGNYQTEGSSMVVLNGQSLGVDGGYWTTSSGDHYYIKGVLEYIKIPAGRTISMRYRANRLVRSQLQVIDPLTDKYCSVYTKNNTDYYCFFETEYSDVSMVTNCITNSENFSGTTGWSGKGLGFKIYPEYNQQLNYLGKGYLAICNNAVLFNSGLKDFRSYISKGFTKGEKYVFRIKAMTESSGKPSGTYTTTSNMKALPFVGTYTVTTDANNKKVYTPTGTSYFNTTVSRVQNGDWIEITLACTTSASYDDLQNLGFFLVNNSSGNIKLWAENIQFFKYVEGAPIIQDDYDALITYVEDDMLLYSDNYYRCIRATKGNAPTNTTYWTSLGSTEPTTVRINPGSFSAQSYANEIWRLYEAGQNVKDTKELVYTYSGSKDGLDTYLSQNSIVPKYGPNGKYEKVRSITGKQSNRFNLLQSLAETFEVWVKFTINHDSTGRTIYIDGKPEKYISFVNEVGGRNGLTFEYGTDLKAITRDINSDAITSKVIVSANNNQYGKNGFCTIARAKDNYPKTTFILNFDYYISQGLLSREQITNDLYSTDSQYIGYYYYLRLYNTELERITEELVKKKGEIDKLNARKTVIDGLIKQTLEKIAQIESDLARYASYSCFCIEEIDEYLKGRGKNDRVAYSAWCVRLSLLNNVEIYKGQQADIDLAIDVLEDKIALLEAEEEYYLGLIDALDRKFYAKYSRFIQEGSWTSDQYYDDDLYYYDGLSTSYTSSRPQISYNISVIRISSIEEYKNKVFNLGDISYVKDTEFFGYESDGITPYKEEVVISEVTSNFDAPQNDEIKVQNYKTQFEDLFQRIAATTQTLQYTTGAYNNTVNNFTPTGEIKSDVLQESMSADPNLTLSGENDSVVISKEGIVVSDENDPNKMMKITAAGIQFSQDKGVTWKDAITGTGVNPQSFAAGTFATDKISISDGDYPTFKWDKYGISAYEFETDPTRNDAISSIKDKQFVRFDKYGLYGIRKEDDVTFDSAWKAKGEQDIIDNANFGVIWSGFFIKSNNNGGYVSITSDDDFQVFAAAAGSAPIERIKIGNIGTISDPNYGIRINDATGSSVLVTGSDGSLWLKKALYVEANDSGSQVQIGALGSDGSGYRVLTAGPSSAANFILYEDGKVVARDIQITGGSVIGTAITEIDGGIWT